MRDFLLNDIRTWMQQVSDVFDTNPRNGNKENTVWLRQPMLEKELEADLFTRGRHICIDGCSGSGKSSLVITTLIKHAIPYTTVQVGRKMDWKSFCAELISKGDTKSRELKGSAAAEWKGLFPTGKLEISFGQKSDPKLSQDLWERAVATANEHTIAKAIAEQNCVVLIDEFERASSDLANSVSEVCKILTQTYSSPMGKLIILGADDVYKKLYDAYSTLDNRLVHQSIPTLPTPHDSWRYLKMGFKRLGKFHPGNSKFARPGDELKAMQAVYFAADGLFKSLTELGVEICKAVGPDIKGITLQNIERVSNGFDARNFGKYRQRFSDLHRLAEANPVTAAVLLHINNNGLGQIHNRENIEHGLASFGKGLVDEAILSLWKSDFLVITGESNQKIFVKNPSWAHTLRVYLSDDVKRKKLEAHLEKPMQMNLGLGVDWDSLDTDSGVNIEDEA